MNDFLRDHIIVIPVELPKPRPISRFRSQAARDAEATNYGGPSYWAYLDEHAQELHDKFAADGQHQLAASMLTRSLSESLMGNDGD